MEGIDASQAPSGTGCVECEQTQSWWFHLRRCAQCGHVGCCDSSPGQHASRHAAQTGHRFVRSFEPGEEWFWDYKVQVMFERGPELSGPPHHPLDQPAPGPAGRVPTDWIDQLHQ
ncbi:UBP-type zinc finger domain-containing protein [Amycolatopsis sp. NPDC003731]